MSLTFGQSPFGTRRGTYDGAIPARVRYWDHWDRRTRAVIAGETLLDSQGGVIFYETDAFPALYFPLDDLRQDLLDPSPRESSVAEPGRWDVVVGDRRVAKAVTASPRDDRGGELLPGMVMIDFGAMDRWFEEDDPVYAHFRDPYHRVDIRAATRHIIVRYGDVTVAESDRPKLLFETGVPVRYYIPFADVRIDLLEKSETVSECPYKGDGQHWHLRSNGDSVEDVAWSLPHPLPEGIAAAEHVCFYSDKVTVEVDGERIRD